MSDKVEKPKRGRKSKKESVPADNGAIIMESTTHLLEDLLEEDTNHPDLHPDLHPQPQPPHHPVEEEEKPQVKKRGRKPKGGKIIQQLIPLNLNKESKPSVILHLKCSIKDLQKQQHQLQENFLLSDIGTFQFSSNNKNGDLAYEMLYDPEQKQQKQPQPQQQQQEHSSYTSVNHQLMENKDGEDTYDDEDNHDENKNSYMKEIWRKLKVLEQKLHTNNVSDKKSACFWCTHDFDNPPVHIPKHYIKDTYHVYGCFCSPECATAFLMEENIDSSTKFERYQLMNHIYSKIYNYNKNIKPAPNPYYMLNKYYGNLSIQEYRSLLKNERLFLIVDKPLTRILPELHEDNEDFIINNKIIPSNNFQIKKKAVPRKPMTKTSILNEKFGLNNSA